MRNTSFSSVISLHSLYPLSTISWACFILIFWSNRIIDPCDTSRYVRRLHLLNPLFAQCSKVKVIVDISFQLLYQVVMIVILGSGLDVGSNRLGMAGIVVVVTDDRIMSGWIKFEGLIPPTSVYCQRCWSWLKLRMALSGRPTAWRWYAGDVFTSEANWHHKHQRPTRAYWSYLLKLNHNVERQWNWLEGISQRIDRYVILSGTRSNVLIRF